MMKYGVNIYDSAGRFIAGAISFFDQSGRKVRPVIVISNNDFNKHSENTLVIGVTSHISKDEYTISLANRDLEEGKLSTVCCIKVENILKIEKDLIIKKICKVNHQYFKKIFINS